MQRWEMQVPGFPPGSCQARNTIWKSPKGSGSRKEPAAESWGEDQQTGGVCLHPQCSWAGRAKASLGAVINTCLTTRSCLPSLSNQLCDPRTGLHLPKPVFCLSCPVLPLRPFCFCDLRTNLKTRVERSPFYAPRLPSDAPFLDLFIINPFL